MNVPRSRRFPYRPIARLNSDVQVFGPTGTWTLPAGTPASSVVRIVAVGGGGGGGGQRESAPVQSGAGGAGGAGGDRVVHINCTVDPSALVRSLRDHVKRGAA